MSEILTNGPLTERKWSIRAAANFIGFTGNFVALDAASGQSFGL
jgi:hypothetical protein